MARIGKIERKTSETDVKIELDLDGSGSYQLDYPLKFLGHMLEQLAKHSGFDLSLTASGDLEVDDHHLAEDTAICLGQALEQALGDKAGIKRMAHAIVPMDDARAEVSVDLSGRAKAVIELPFSEFEERRVGDTSKENIEHFLESFAVNAKMTLNAKVSGKNDHHKVEATFKALALALREAVKVTGETVPSTKGVV